jgi:hypothetical protein
VLALRWFLDGTRVAQLATDNRLSSSTTYRYLHEAIDVLAAAACQPRRACTVRCSPPGWPGTAMCTSMAP